MLALYRDVLLRAAKHSFRSWPALLSLFVYTGIMFVGLQGSGKTTSVGKLARWLEKTHKKKPLLVAADIYRPAAVEQLRTLGRQLDMPVFSLEGKDPVTICREAATKAAQ